MQCGLLGRKLGHSYSPQIHRQLGSYSYCLFEKEPEELESFLKSGEFTGLNVTVPYKKAVIPFLDELSPQAQALGAVNTVIRKANGTLVGHNTDYYGFDTMLKDSGIKVSGKKALVCGSGGASNTVCAVLKNAGAEVIVLSRNGENNYTNLHRHLDAALIVNATPLGMYPNVQGSPIEDLRQFSHLEGVLDVVYNPARTTLLLEAEAMGLPWANGLKMLVAQAKESAQWFTGTQIPDESIDKIYHQLRRQTENIILIGMPGCGKTTVGKALATMTGRKVYDADSVLEDTFQRKIAEIIPSEGEDIFRGMESQVLEELGKLSGIILATGGGCVTKPENYRKLHRNGTIVYLQRPVSSLPTDGRPLSHKEKMEEMFRKRDPLYRKFADLSIANQGSPEETARNILKALEEMA